MDTIYALASARGKAGIAVIRLSGPESHSAAARLCGAQLPVRGMSLHSLRNNRDEILDQALILTFSAPASFTGEDVAELQIHGSTAGVAAVLAALSPIPGVRAAEPGEFTRRALENGKMDLAEVEGLADLIDAETEAQRRQARLLLDGALGDSADRWRRRLIRAAALIEATIDFADEDVPTDVTTEVHGLLHDVYRELTHEVTGVVMAERIRNGFEVAIIGAPNVGKSTLINALAGREAAITSEFEGTTRDVIEVRMDLAGLPVTFLDTAGLRRTSDFVENKGIELARARAAQADLRVFLAEDDAILDVEQQADDIRLRPKRDLRADQTRSVSGLTGEGIEDLIGAISEILARRCSTAGIATRDRHRVAMQTALEALSQAQNTLKGGADHYDIAAEDLRRAIRALESLVGRVDVENLLDEIFASFCLGK